MPTNKYPPKKGRHFFVSFAFLPIKHVAISITVNIEKISAKPEIKVIKH